MEKSFTDAVLDARKDDIKRACRVNEKPKDCSECVYFDAYGKHIISGKAHFPSLCEKDLLWFDCKGKEGLKRG